MICQCIDDLSEKQKTGIHEHSKHWKLDHVPDRGWSGGLVTQMQALACRNNCPPSAKEHNPGTGYPIICIYPGITRAAR